jgi:hypothetical protein
MFAPSSTISRQSDLRENVKVYPLGHLMEFSEYPCDDESLIKNIQLPIPEQLPAAVDAELCRYGKGLKGLDPELWSFAHMVR